MKIIFHERFYEVYTTDPAAAAGRMEAVMRALGEDFHFVAPPPAAEDDLALVHARGHIESIKSCSPERNSQRMTGREWRPV